MGTYSDVAIYIKDPENLFNEFKRYYINEYKSIMDDVNSDYYKNIFYFKRVATKWYTYRPEVRYFAILEDFVNKIVNKEDYENIYSIYNELEEEYDNIIYKYIEHDFDFYYIILGESDIDDSFIKYKRDKNKPDDMCILYSIYCEFIDFKHAHMGSEYENKLYNLNTYKSILPKGDQSVGYYLSCLDNKNLIDVLKEYKYKDILIDKIKEGWFIIDNEDLNKSTNITCCHKEIDIEQSNSLIMLINELIDHSMNYYKNQKNYTFQEYIFLDKYNGLIGKGASESRSYFYIIRDIEVLDTSKEYKEFSDYMELLENLS